MNKQGGVSFFDKSLCLFKDGATATATSNTAARNFPLGTNKYYQWESAGSDDSTTETISISLPSVKSVSRIFVLGHNLKDFSITSPDGSFTNVTSLDGEGITGISETSYSRNMAYYEFDSIDLDQISLVMNTTQSADDEKTVNQIILTNEIGSLKGFPAITNVTIDKNLIKDKTITGRSIIEKGFEVADFSMRLTNYPYQSDIDILDLLHERENPFLVWLCGGKPDNFRIKQRGWRLEDVYQMQIDSDLRNGYQNNVYSLGATGRYGFEEVV